MTSTNVTQINAVAKLLKSHFGHQAKKNELQELVADVKSLQGITTGEETFLTLLDERLDQNTAYFQELADTQTLEESDSIIKKIEAVLEDFIWDEMEYTRKDLKSRKHTLGNLQRKENVEQQNQEEFRNEETFWSDKDTLLSEIEEMLTQAVNRRAAVAHLQQKVRALRSIIDGAQRELIEGITSNVTLPKEKWREQAADLDRLKEQVEGRLQEAKTLFIQTDLILLRSPIIDETRYDYTALLRTRSQRGQRGFNIQDIRNVALADRNYFETAIEKATKKISSSTRELAKETNRSIRHFVATEAISGKIGAQNILQHLEEVGEFMYRIVVPESMQSFLTNTKGAITITTNDLELPWELIAYPKVTNTNEQNKLNVLCLERPVGRIPMGYALPRREPVPAPTESKKRFAFFYADPREDLPGAEEEVEKIIEGLEAQQGENVEINRFFGPEASGQQLNKILLRENYDVIHFAGHAGFDENAPELSNLLLHNNEPFFSEKVRTLLSGQPFIFLNACQTGRTANEALDNQIEYMQKPAAGLASSFIYGGALGCIGSLWPIYDDAAAKFAIDLYSLLLEGYMIGEAVRRARVANYEAYQNHITWAAYVLYGNPTLRLVD